MCIQIALDAKRLTEAGWALLQVRAHVDAAYGALGPGTDTPPVVD